MGQPVVTRLVVSKGGSTTTVREAHFGVVTESLPSRIVGLGQRPVGTDSTIRGIEVHKHGNVNVCREEVEGCGVIGRHLHRGDRR
jgi:hypothetical protein